MKNICLVFALCAGVSFGLQAQTAEAKVDAPKAASCCASAAEKAKCAEMKVAEANAADATQTATATNTAAVATAKPACCASKVTDSAKPCAGKTMAENKKEEELNP